MKLEYITISSIKPDKTKCGDFAEVLVLKDEAMMLFSVADGLGSCPCDWKVSKQAIEDFNAYLKQTKLHYKNVFL